MSVCVCACLWKQRVVAVLCALQGSASPSVYMCLILVCGGRRGVRRVLGIHVEGDGRFRLVTQGFLLSLAGASRTGGGGALGGGGGERLKQKGCG